MAEGRILTDRDINTFAKSEHKHAIADVNKLQSILYQKASAEHVHDSIEADLSGTTIDLKFVITSKAIYTGMDKDSNTLYFVQE